MFVRVWDKPNNRYYKSIVYAMVDIGYFLKYIVYSPFTECFELVNYLDMDEDTHKPLVEMIQPDTEGFKEYTNALLLKYKHYCQENGKEMTVRRLFGYPDVCECFALITELLANKCVPARSYPIPLRKLTDAEHWNYITEQADIDALMKLFVGFHDSTLDKLVYSENSDCADATVTFDNSGWYGVIELCFEGVQAIRIRPAGENISRYIYDATLLSTDEAIFWADDYMEAEDLSFDGCYIKALNLKWRKLP